MTLLHAPAIDPAVQQVLNLIPATGNILIVLDKDGTLDPLVAERNAARVPKKTVESILELSKLPDVEIIIISGRGVQDLKELVGPLPIEYWGLHGAENGRGDSSKSTLAVSAQVKEQVAQAISAIENDSRLAYLEKTYGVPVSEMIEKKEIAGSLLGVAVHFRTIIEKAGQENYYQIEEIIKAVVTDASKDLNSITIQPGNCVFEIKPQGITKGTAVEAILARGKEYAKVIVGGDDSTDLYMMNSAVELLGDKAIPVVVGCRIRHPLGMDLDTPSQMGELLEAIAKKRSV